MYAIIRTDFNLGFNAEEPHEKNKKECVPMKKFLSLVVAAVMLIGIVCIAAADVHADVAGGGDLVALIGVLGHNGHEQ